MISLTYYLSICNNVAWLFIDNVVITWAAMVGDSYKFVTVSLVYFSSYVLHDSVKSFSLSHMLDDGPGSAEHVVSSHCLHFNVLTFEPIDIVIKILLRMLMRRKSTFVVFNFESKTGSVE